MQWMNLHHLKYFLVIAEEGSLAAASKKLLVGQPSLSAQLKQFEEWLGHPLFQRVGKKFVITPTGEYVLKYARAIKDLEDELLNNMNHAEDLVKKELVLGAQESVPKSILANAISALSASRAVKIKVLEGTGDELFEKLTTGKIDLFIGNFRPLSAGKEVVYVSLGKEPVSVWGSKKFSHLKKGFPKSIESSPFVLPGFQNQLRHDFEKFMLQHGIGFTVAVEAQDTALQKELSSRGEGLTVLGDQSAKAWANSGLLVKIGSLNEIRQEYWLGMVKRSLDNQHIKSVLETFRHQ